MLRDLIGDRIRAIVGGDRAGALRYREPPGDPGLFGPASVTWRVHADFTAMLAGGIGALLLQCLHPLALAGVWDHSRFREDMRGRLARTAGFIAATTYGSTRVAEDAMAQVRRIHARVRGTGEDGRPYAADDPLLLYWVHLAECSSFLAAHRAIVDPAMTPADADRYWAEKVRIPAGLGCTTQELPAGRFATTTAEATADLARYRPQLRRSARTDTVVELLHRLPTSAGTGPLRDLIVRCGIQLLPGWALDELGIARASEPERAALLHAVRLAARPVRWALGGGIAGHARHRVGLTPH
jgi:uncharacterized protein (DUF2236 family)